MRKMIPAGIAACWMIAAGAALANPSGDASIAHAPLGGYENSHWFDYQTDLLEAEEEMRSDLADADDEGDVFDARAEYREELADALTDYQKEAIEAGLPVGRVYVVGD